ncbi:MAG TPA: FAD-dependent thymidylate synthase [Candidatus Saccharibacteria bacterium]|nr:FAD-dependent thymidylate synthase [Candidatus Saccharibacteria bacterium]
MKRPAYSGKFFVIEGTDASGKTTQFKKMAERLAQEGYDVVTFDFPQYENGSSFHVREYLKGTYGSGDQVGPYTASVFFALDRFAAKDAIQRALLEGKVVLANRFTGSNMAHQGTKFIHPEERRGYFIWADNLEFQMLAIPRPTANFVLRVDAPTAKRLLDERSKANPERPTDILESDIDHLARSVQVYDDLCTLFPRDFIRIDCVRNKQLMSIDHIHEILWASIESLLPKPGKHKGTIAEGSSLHEPYTMKNDEGIISMTEAGKNFLKEAVTTTEDNVYAFTDKISPITVAAAMARLSRRADDMRITILDEFSSLGGKKDEKLLQRVITAYGDDSVQQLVGQHVVVEGASNLLTKKLEWGRLAAYLEQSTRYIYFDQKDENGKYKYIVPEHFDTKTKEIYVAICDQIFDLYSEMVHALTDYVRAESSTPQAERDIAWQGATRAQACDAVRAVLPVSTKSTVGIFASGQALESLIMHLLADELPEARETGNKILAEARKVLSTFLERADKPERGGAMVAYQANTRASVKKLADDMLPATNSATQKSVDLISYWPRNELDLVADMLYEHSNLSLREIQSAVETWTYDEKESVFQAYMGERLNRRHKPGRALEKAHYSWDIVCDYGIFRDLQRHRMVDDLAWQDLTPRYGYDVPDLVEKAGLTEQFQHCFDMSLKLHSILIAAGYEKEAQYATLLGHKMRWKITYNARQAFHFHELRTTPHGHPGYRKLVRDMHDVLSEKHPLLGTAMKFVNQDEDPELTRLAAERYTQYKLEKLDSI